MQPFVYTADPARVVFGAGTLARLPDEVAALGCSRAMVLSTPEQKGMAADVEGRLGAACAGAYNGARMHTPVEVTEDAIGRISAARADSLIAVGGGSTTGLGKAIALRTGLKLVAVPTTYAGSEMTPILGETADGVKTTQRTPKVLPQTVIYDTDLTLSLPPRLSATSGINALAHAAEALYAPDSNPIVALMAEEAIRALAGSLPRIVTHPGDREARTTTLYGAWLCGICLGRVAMSLHHKLCHVLGGAFDLPHADTHTVILPYALAYNAAAAPGAMAAIARSLGSADASAGVRDLSARLGAPGSLREIGMPEAGIERATELALNSAYANPRPLEADAIRLLLRRAYAGEPPGSL